MLAFFGPVLKSLQPFRKDRVDLLLESLLLLTAGSIHFHQSLPARPYFLFQSIIPIDESRDLHEGFSGQGHETGDHRSDRSTLQSRRRTRDGSTDDRYPEPSE